MKRTFVAAALLTAISTSPEAARAQVSMVTTRPGTPTVSDEIDWGQFNVLSSFQQSISTPQRFESYIDGIRGSIGEKGSPLFVVRNFDNNPHYGNDAITANFAPGDWAIEVGAQLPSVPPPQILISFLQPVSFVGTQLGRNGGGPFTARVQVFSNNTLLGTFSENGNTTDLLDNSAIFLGVMDAKAEITDVIYTVTDPTGQRVGLLINQVSVIQ